MTDKHACLSSVIWIVAYVIFQTPRGRAARLTPLFPFLFQQMGFYRVPVYQVPVGTTVVFMDFELGDTKLTTRYTPSSGRAELHVLTPLFGTECILHKF